MALSAGAKENLRIALTEKAAADEIAAAIDATGALSATEAGYLDGVTAGTVTASKAVVVDADGKVNTLDVTTPKWAGVTMARAATVTTTYSSSVLTTTILGAKLKSLVVRLKAANLTK